jgi:uncharacterized protein (TIGR02453 family)
MAFRGWSVEAIEFYEGLEADNSRTYWQDHKATYEGVVKAPMETLLAELEAEFGPGKIFRPNRDIRFSADKSPYKTSISATLGTGGYLTLSSSGLGVGSGMYMMEPDQLERYRRAVDDQRTGTALVKIVAGAAKAGLEITGHESLKNAPRGYPNDHPRVDLLRHKGLIMWKQWPVASWLGTAKAKTRVVDFLRAAVPLNKWLDANVS